ncbi:MAG TPA: zinc ribbon domain-containing protein, partial [Euryarchaeota archaeon]|nr:zinc ribbon domain-containing protein [Euryarchaeota archaeon]
MPKDNDRDIQSTLECPRCGAKVSAEDENCVVCDHKLTSKERAHVEQEELICPSCGAQISKDDGVCPVCEFNLVSKTDENPCEVCGEMLPKGEIPCKNCGAGQGDLPPPQEDIGQETVDAVEQAVKGAFSKIKEEVRHEKEVMEDIIEETEEEVSKDVAKAESSFEEAFEEAAQGVGKAVVDAEEKIEEMVHETEDDVEEVVEAVEASVEEVVDEARHAQKHFSKGMTHMGQKEWHDALMCFEEVLHITPTHKPALNSKAQILTELGRHDEAGKTYRQIASLMGANGDDEDFVFIDEEDREPTYETIKKCNTDVKYYTPSDDHPIVWDEIRQVFYCETCSKDITLDERIREVIFKKVSRPCPKCSSPTRYIDQYQRFYCDDCREYPVEVIPEWGIKKEESVLTLTKEEHYFSCPCCIGLIGSVHGNMAPSLMEDPRYDDFMREGAYHVFDGDSIPELEGKAPKKRHNMLLMLCPFCNVVFERHPPKKEKPPKKVMDIIEEEVVEHIVQPIHKTVRKTDFKAITVYALLGILLIASLSPFFISLPEIERDRIILNGDYGAWADVASFSDPIDAAVPQVDIVDTRVISDARNLYLYASIAENEALFTGPEVTSLRFMIDVDDDATTGYLFEGIGADYEIEITGWDGFMKSSSFRFFNGVDQIDYDLFESAGTVRAFQVGNHGVEAAIPLAMLGVERTDSIKVLSYIRDFHGNSDVLDIAMPVWGGSLDVSVADRISGNTLANGDNHVMDIEMSVYLGAMEISSIEISQAAGFTATDGIGSLELRRGNTPISTATLTNGAYRFELNNVGYDEHESETFGVYLTGVTQQDDAAVALELTQVNVNMGISRIQPHSPVRGYAGPQSQMALDGLFDDWTSWRDDPQGDVHALDESQPAQNPNVDLLAFESVYDNT